MRALVVYESMYGNTRLIAEAIASGLARHLDVKLFEVGVAPHLDPSVDLVVIGGPTHAFGMSRANSRKSAAGQSEQPLVSQGIGIREWLARIGPTSTPVAAAAFDTRINKPRMPGSAAAVAQRRLRRLGYLPVGPESFYVDGSTGPVVAGECERARRWGEELVSKVAPVNA